ncbi:MULTISPECIES: protease inhibitor I42 family protein [Streptomyces]|uniref:protease inhibitor I42 family protein n=1 Tax=Streptomyces TaxID=1883 RepID=UPI0029B5AC73|nr:protease inhibitor I42 family protein [Streptomyces sp. WI03-4A]MDX2594389.1 protease inhibitor I42 family protein [Streptomyces sp. WI03-4A]
MNLRTVLTPAAAAAAGVLLLTGCGSSGGADEYGTDQRAVTVAAGDRFTLKVPANPALGENWYLAGPRPDTDVLTYRGKREEEEGSDNTGGGDGTQFFDFTARKPGRATVRLLHCPMGSCHSGTRSAAPLPSATASGKASASPYPTATGTPDDRPAFFVYTITVR